MTHVQNFATWRTRTQFYVKQKAKPTQVVEFTGSGSCKIQARLQERTLYHQPTLYSIGLNSSHKRIA